MSNDSSKSALSLQHRYEGPFYRRIMLGGIKHIPTWLQRLTMPMWGGIFYFLIRKAREAVLRNLETVAGKVGFWQTHRRGLVTFRNYAQMLTDSYKVHLGQPLTMEVESIGRTPELVSLIREKGGIMATGHIGMWQVGPFLAEWRDLPPFYVARAEEPNPLVQKWEQRFRDRFKVIYTTGSPFSALSIAKVLREKSVVGMQIDRVLSDTGLTVKMCGKDARFPMGPALLARVTGAPLIPSFFVIDESLGRPRLIHHVGPAVIVENTRDREADVRRATEAMVAIYEKIVCKYPTQWYQFFDFFDVRVPLPVDGIAPSASLPPTVSAEN
ncbi:MAG TPA: lysophospholipid acyltransferase family protein [Pseudomonadota bacterium]|nr:lysophospholipid acyltransferase family protein [Pseudomonadota bacterium]HNK46009.1 lysophospholipid acyltransferase family protein [Pseudomonadota bacterium]